MNTCEICDKSFKRKFDLQRHFKSAKHVKNLEGRQEEHTNEVTGLHCNVCDKSFEVNQRLQKHLKSNKHALAINKDLFKCNMKYGRKDCPRKFKTNTQLQKHIIEDHYDIQELTEYIAEDFFKNHKLSDKQLSSIKNENYFDDYRKTAPSYIADMLKTTIFNRKLKFIKGNNMSSSNVMYYKFNGVNIIIPVNIEAVVGIINRVIDNIKEIDNFYEDYFDRIVFRGDPCKLNEVLYDINEMPLATKQDLIKKFKTCL